MADGDHRTPFGLVSEKETLVDFLDYVRAAIVRKASDLADDDARRPMVPSGTSLLGLVAHLTLVEYGWFQYDFAGLDTPAPPLELRPEDDAATVIAAYQAAIARSNAIIAGCTDLETIAARNYTAPEPMSMRWILVHMIEETARHAGHADILREQIDGTTGR